MQRAFVERAALRAGQRVLEIGCGTGNVTLLAKQACPGAQVVGLDPDVRALARARDKAARAELDVRFEEGFADALPFADAAFDVVLSSFMWHHLPPDVQRATLRELLRVLAPGGKLQLLDFVRGQPGRRQQRRSGHARSAPELHSALVDAGFEAVRAEAQPRVLWLRVCAFSAVRASVISAGAQELL